MLIPIGHENMQARRWPVVTLSLIVINVVVFIATNSAIQKDAPELGELKAHILMLAAMHPELTEPPAAKELVDDFRKRNPGLWTEIQQPNREVADAWDAKIRLADNPELLQQEMNSLAERYAQLKATSLTQQYAFVPAHPTALTYITANFLHGGWMHLIGNMWFLWLAGFVLEDAWGRPLYTVVYFIAGAAALQFHALLNPGSTVATLGASGAVAALMGAFLVRFPKMRIEMAWVLWLIRIRMYRFKAPAYTLLPLWLLMEVFYGTLFGSSTGVAHWAHVGGFAFGAVAAVILRYSGLEHKANKAIEDEVSWDAHPDITQANELIDKGQLDQAAQMLEAHSGSDPNSVDARNLLRQVYWQRNQVAEYQQATVQLCDLHLKLKESDQAWKDYEEYVAAGGDNMPAATWYSLCRIAEEQQWFDRALNEYEKLALAYPNERQSLMAQMAAARLWMKLNRPEEALRLYEAAAASPVPHLDLEQTIMVGIRNAKAAMPNARGAGAGT